jgi:aryl-alcohol dehydrogenase-like predicted oxidoreductase
MGCWSYGGGEYWGPQRQKDVNEVVRFAVECGCNFFDTAESYNNGASEEALGHALKGLPRGQLIIGSKISPSHTWPKIMIERCDASLRRLQTDYIDLYMVHWPITPHSIRHFSCEESTIPSTQEAFATLNYLKEKGKIRHIGVSNFGRARLDEALATGVEIVINELPFSLLNRAIELDILPYCREQGIGVLGYMALMQGVLTDAYPTLAQIPVWRRRTRHFDCHRSPQCRHGSRGEEEATDAALQEIRRIALHQGMSVQELALKWAIAGVGITSSLCGSRNMRNLNQNLKATREPLAPDIIQQLNAATKPLLDKLGPSFDYYESISNDRTC